jgi:hypothetical protein
MPLCHRYKLFIEGKRIVGARLQSDSEIPYVLNKYCQTRMHSIATVPLLETLPPTLETYRATL